MSVAIQICMNTGFVCIRVQDSLAGLLAVPVGYKRVWMMTPPSKKGTHIYCWAPIPPSDEFVARPEQNPRPAFCGAHS